MDAHTATSNGKRKTKAVADTQTGNKNTSEEDAQTQTGNENL